MLHETDTARCMTRDELGRCVWHAVADGPEVKLRKKVTADKEGAGPPVPNILVERIPEAESRRFYVLSADIEAHGHNPGLSKLCSAVVTWKSDKTTQRRTSLER